MPQLSIITINFNNSVGLEKTIQSVIQQIFTDFEFIIIDGGSSDGSMEIIKKYSTTISFWSSEKDSGIYNAQNKGIDHAKGTYCLFLNSGDCLANDQVLQTIFSEKLTHGIVYGDMITIDESGVKKELKMPAHIGIKKMLTDTLWHPVSFIKKELFSNYGKYNETYKIVADYEFFVKVIIEKKVSMKHLPIAISIFDKTGTSSVKSSTQQLMEERKKIQDAYFNPFVLFLFRLYSKLRN